MITCLQQQLGKRQDRSGSLSLHTKTVNTGEGRLMTGERSELRHLGRTRKQAVISFFLLTAVCSGASVEHETLVEKLNQYKENTKKQNHLQYHGTHGFQITSVFSSLVATNGQIPEMML